MSHVKKEIEKFSSQVPCESCIIGFRINPTFENERHSSNDIDERNLPGDTRAYKRHEG